MLLTSNQNEIHQDLEILVKKHLQSNYKKPIAEHSLRAFDQLFQKFKNENRTFILDSGCGTGLSTRILAEKFPEYHIIGIDKSELRLSKTSSASDNLSYCRSELVDFWRLALEANIKIKEHYLLYPNPWPKKKHLIRRWHGHPIFPDLLKLGQSITLRSDWNLYIDEFELALKIAGINNIVKKNVITGNAISAFEQKYIIQGRSLFELKAELYPTYYKFLPLGCRDK